MGASGASFPPAAPSVSHHDAESYGPEVTKNPQLVLVANALEVDSVLTHRNDSSLRMWYKKYNAWNDVVAKLDGLKSANQWTLPDIGRSELINLFAGRAYWHSHIKKAFKDIHNYKIMVEWLERDSEDDEPSDLQVWHLEKSHYTFKDLGLWMELWIRIIRGVRKRKGRLRLKQASEMRKGESLSLMTMLMKLRLRKRGESYQVEKLNLESRLSNITCTCI